MSYTKIFINIICRLCHSVCEDDENKGCPSDSGLQFSTTFSIGRNSFKLRKGHNCAKINSSGLNALFKWVLTFMNKYFKFEMNIFDGFCTIELNKVLSRKRGITPPNTFRVTCFMFPFWFWKAIPSLKWKPFKLIVF